MSLPGYVFLQGGTTAEPAEITVEAINFNGTSSTILYDNNLWRDFSANTPTMTCSFWIKPASENNFFADYIATCPTAGDEDHSIALLKGTGGDGQMGVLFNLESGAGVSNGLSVQTNTGITIGSWNHVLFSVNSSAPSSPDLVINGSAVSPTISYNNSTMFGDAATEDSRMGSHDGAGSSQVDFLDGDLAEFFLKNTYYDLSVSSNIELFRTSTGKPTDISTLSPLVYLNGNASTWTNSGSSSLGTQTLTDITTATTSPSD
jgi:hypothetical protein